MSSSAKIPLAAEWVRPHGDEYRAICGWKFADNYVNRLLSGDVLNRLVYGQALMAAYRDPTGTTVGFGTLQVCDDWSRYAQGRHHIYIPLLAVNPTMLGRGHGQTILEHLIDAAAIVRAAFVGNQHDCDEALFLDVYTSNAPGLGLYRKCGFVEIAGPLVDPDENNAPFVVMARKITTR